MRRRDRLGAAIIGTVVLASSALPTTAQTPPGWETDFSKHTVPLDEIVSGGPPKDGIPSIDDPSFEPAADAAHWLDGREPVLVVTHGGRARAYPLQVLIWHEIVNDRIGDLPVAVTYCPLCNTGIVFDRRHDGRVLEFGTTGRLRHSDLVMYDRQTESWWQQASGEAIVGQYAGDELRWVPAQMISFREFREAYPNGVVLSRPEGSGRPYGRNPYQGYDSRRGPLAPFFRADTDDRLPAMERVVTVKAQDETVAYPVSRLAEVRVANDEVDGSPIVVFWTPGTASALDARTTAEGRDVGAAGVFDRRIDGRTLSFEYGADGFVDEQTGSRWDVTGRAVAGPLQGRRLEPVIHGNYFWFAWGVFEPDTRIWP